MKKEIKDFDDLEIYQLALDLADWVYDITLNFPSDEKFNVISQLKRASTSIGANIAEGYGRFHYKENIQYCRQARGSLTETKHFLIFSKRRKFISQEVLDKFLPIYSRLTVKINNYIRSIKKSATL